MRGFLGESGWRDALRTAEDAAAVVPATHCVGVDVLIEHGGERMGR